MFFIPLEVDLQSNEVYDLIIKRNQGIRMGEPGELGKRGKGCCFNYVLRDVFIFSLNDFTFLDTVMILLIATGGSDDER